MMLKNIQIDNKFNIIFTNVLLVCVCTHIDMSFSNFYNNVKNVGMIFSAYYKRRNGIKRVTF